MIILVGLVVLVFSVARYSRALSVDVIGLPIRAWAETKYTQASKIYKLVTCYWCNAYWISLAHSAAALILTCLWMHDWWPMATLPFLFPAIGYLAAWVVDRTVG